MTLKSSSLTSIEASAGNPSGHSSTTRTIARRLLAGQTLEPDSLPDGRAYSRLRSWAKSQRIDNVRDIVDVGYEVDSVDFLPLDRLVSREDLEAMRAAISAVLPTGKFTSGPHVEAFESEMAEFLGVRHVLGASSGTEALAATLIALGTGPGSEVVIPANSFAATENSVLLTGATPVLADIEPGRLTLAPEAVAAAITSRTSAVVPVHLYGRCADMAGLVEVTRPAGVPLVEDAAQGIGLDGVGRYSTAAVLSFNPYKNLGAAGKAGGVATNDPSLAQRVTELLYHGFEPGHKNVKVTPFGMNARLDNLQAAVLRARLDGLSCSNLARSLIAHRYCEHLADFERQGKIVLPAWDVDHVWHLFTIQVIDRHRDELMSQLSAHGVQVDLYYPILTHQHKIDPPLALATKLGNTERAHCRMLQLPLHPALTIREADHVVDALVQVMQ